MAIQSILAHIASAVSTDELPKLIGALAKQALEHDPVTGTDRGVDNFDPVYGSVDGTREIALTFDDGPKPSTTGPILKTLAEYDVRATFFVVGRLAERPAGRDLVKQMLDEGHTVGNHTWSHPNLKKSSDALVRQELERTQELLVSLGVTTNYWRAPFGARGRTVLRIARELGLEHVGWNVDPKDWSKKHRNMKWVTSSLDDIEEREDSCLVLHDIQRTTAKYLPTLLGELAGQHQAGTLVYVNEF